ncbi:MAG: ADP-ribosylation factor-like protein [Candidatus Hodarchaeota archaeon]
MSTVLRKLFRKKAKQYTVAISGLDRAGKTTCVNRLLKQTHIETVRTMGVDHRKVRYRNLEFGIWDLGGQKTFREFIWTEYIKMANAVVFVIDAADSRLSEAAEAFWQTMDTISSEEQEKGREQLAPVLFLANKYDLSEARPFDLLIDDLNLSRASRTNRPIGLYQISAKTGENFYDAWDWLSSALTGPGRDWSVSIRSAILFDLRSKDAIALASFGPVDNDTMTVFMSEIENIAAHLAPHPTGMDVTFSEELHMVTVKRAPFVCSLIEDLDDSVSRSRLICERIIKPMQGRDAGNIYTSDQLKAFLRRTYPLDIYKPSRSS